jgi:hypothetical protein
MKEEDIIEVNNTKYIRYDKVIELIKHQKAIAIGFSYKHLKMLQKDIEQL